MIPRVTGIMVQYYKVCKRELWLFAHQINYESNYITWGRLIHQGSYSREKKNILIDDTISPDFLRKRGNMVVVEIKKSSKLEEPVRYQVLYYLWYLKQKGIDAEGGIVYPKERKKEKVILTRDIEEEILQIIKDIEEIVRRSAPPEPIKKPYCKKCSYYELCWCYDEAQLLLAEKREAETKGEYFVLGGGTRENTNARSECRSDICVR